MRRSTRSTSELLLALALALGLIAPARAQGPEAKRLFEQGERAYHQGHFREALAKYRAAYQLRPLPALLFDIGQCYRFLGDFRSARKAMNDFAAQTPEPLSPVVKAALKEVEAALAQAERKKRKAPDVQSTAATETAPVELAPPEEAHGAPSSLLLAETLEVPELEPAVAATPAPAEAVSVPVAWEEEPPAERWRFLQWRVLAPFGASVVAAGSGAALLASAQHRADLLTGGDGGGPRISPAVLDRAQAQALLSEGMTEQWLGIGLCIGAALLAVAGVALAWVGWDR